MNACESQARVLLLELATALTEWREARTDALSFDPLCGTPDYINERIAAENRMDETFERLHDAHKAAFEYCCSAVSP